MPLPDETPESARETPPRWRSSPLHRRVQADYALEFLEADTVVGDILANVSSTTHDGLACVRGGNTDGVWECWGCLRDLAANLELPDLMRAAERLREDLSGADGLAAAPQGFRAFQRVLADSSG